MHKATLCARVYLCGHMLATSCGSPCRLPLVDIIVCRTCAFCAHSNANVGWNDGHRHHHHHHSPDAVYIQDDDNDDTHSLHVLLVNLQKGYKFDWLAICSECGQEDVAMFCMAAPPICYTNWTRRLDCVRRSIGEGCV